MLFIGLTYGLLSCPKKRVQERRGLSDSIHVQYVSLGNSVFAYSIISAARGARAEQRDSPTFPAALLNSYIINFSYSITVYTRIMGTQMLPCLRKHLRTAIHLLTLHVSHMISFRELVYGSVKSSCPHSAKVTLLYQT